MNELTKKLEQQKTFREKLKSLTDYLHRYPEDYTHLQVELSIVNDMVDKKIQYLEQTIKNNGN